MTMMPSEVVLLAGATSVVLGRAVSWLAQAGLSSMRAAELRREGARAMRLAPETPAKLARTVVFNTVNERLERENRALRLAHASSQAAAANYLERIARLEGLLHAAGVEVPVFDFVPSQSADLN